MPAQPYTHRQWLGGLPISTRHVALAPEDPPAALAASTISCEGAGTGRGRQHLGQHALQAPRARTSMLYTRSRQPASHSWARVGMRARCRVRGMRASRPARTPATVGRRLRVALEQWARRARVAGRVAAGARGWPLGACVRMCGEHSGQAAQHSKAPAATRADGRLASVPSQHTLQARACWRGPTSTCSRRAGGLRARCIVIFQVALRSMAGSGAEHRAALLAAPGPRRQAQEARDLRRAAPQADRMH